MITENATVVFVKDNETLIETSRKSSCEQCSASAGCGTSVLSKVMGKKLSRMNAINEIDAQIGDEVIIGLSEKTLLKTAFMTYMLPLLYLFLFAVLGKVISNQLQINNSEFIIVGFSFFGFYLGLKKLKIFSDTILQNKNYQPVILKKADQPSVLVKL